MSSQKKLICIIAMSYLICSFFAFITPDKAFAYVDPNTGGYVFQLLFPIFSAIIAGYLFFKNQIKKIFRKIKGLVFKSK